MEALGVAICVIIVGGFLTGIILLTLDEQREWLVRKKRNRKD
jgi:hypothetical protein